MALLNMRTIVRAHLSRERLDVLLSVLAPFVIMMESGYANAWVFAGGRLGLDFISVMALGRGIFLEALIYVCFKLVRMFVERASTWGGRAALVLPLAIGLVGMIVSAGCNLAWMSHSPEMQQALRITAQLMPDWMANIFRVGLGLLFPVAVGLFALFDVRHLVEEALKSAHLDNRAVHVHRAEMHRTSYLRSLKKAGRKAQKQYDDICEADTNQMVDKARKGDLSFGADDLAREAARSSVTRVSQVSPPALSAGKLPQRTLPPGLPQPQPVPQAMTRRI